ncbi:MAG: hypothetical protein CL761_05970 [Chloroflexi bacterium]|nr:hypothetical protein [Chloroflexota bacterium]|tara:strand:+ start:36134 stop:37048 length:915 start_codon:yes stop_codon:yes gene_type:complete
MDNLNNKKINKILHESLEEALDLIRNSINKNYDISDKNNIQGDNPVTDIDLATQNLILNKIKKNFPNHGILGEEGDTKQNVESDYLWIIDPIDGTKNFINQIPLYCVSIAIFYKGDPIISGVGIPWNENCIITAHKDKGIKSNFYRERSDSKKSKPAAGLLSFAPSHFTIGNIVKKNFFSNSGELRNLGSTAAELALVANGNAQFAISGYAFTWDFAASWLLINESRKKIYFGDMNENKWVEINPWKSYYKNGIYDLKGLKDWRGKFLGCDKNISEFLISNLSPHGRKNKNILRKIRRFFYING